MGGEGRVCSWEADAHAMTALATAVQAGWKAGIGIGRYRNVTNARGNIKQCQAECVKTWDVMAGGMCSATRQHLTIPDLCQSSGQNRIQLREKLSVKRFKMQVGAKLTDLICQLFARESGFMARSSGFSPDPWYDIDKPKTHHSGAQSHESKSCKSRRLRTGQDAEVLYRLPIQLLAQT